MTGWYNANNQVKALTFAQYTLAQAILTHGAAYVGISRDHLLARNRLDHIVLARGLCYEMLLHHGLTLAQIARLVDRDHSTVLHGVKRFRSRPDAETLRTLFNETLPIPLRVWENGSLTDALAKALRHLPDAERTGALAYIEGDLLGKAGRPWEMASRWRGHQALISRPDLSADIRLILGHFGEQGAAAALLARLRAGRAAGLVGKGA